MEIIKNFMVQVSVIVPFFNASRTIKSTLNSIIIQSFKDFECILINDGSEDDSLKIVKTFIDLDKRFKLYNQNNKGVVSARNFGIRKSQGRFISFLDADDLWHYDFLKESISIRENYNYPLGITHSSYIRFSKNKNMLKLFEINPPKEINRKNILNKNFLPLLTTMIDREVIKEINFVDIRPEDYKLWIDLIYIKKYKSLSIRKKLAFYRISEFQRSKNKLKSIYRIHRFFLNLPNTNFLKRNFNIFNWLLFNITERIFSKEIKDKKYPRYINSFNE